MSRDILRVARKKGLDGLRFHDLRHTAATFMLGLGVPIKVVSERLGHASTSITNDLYAHVTPDMGTAAVQRMDAFLNGSS